ncbi:hypothetical protein H311_04663, partial [Anncaliia algerae PRA109]
GNNILYDESKDQRNESDKYFVKRKSKEDFNTVVESDRYVSFRRNMSEKNVKVEIFMIECSDDFNEVSLKSKMLIIMKRSVVELREMFYDLGSRNRLPETWEAFKELIIEFCTEEGIDSIVKYREESWSRYLQRLNDWKIKKGYSDEKILSHIRKQYLPKDLRMIFLSLEIGLDVAICRVKEWENFKFTNKKYGKEKGNFNQNKNKLDKLQLSKPKKEVKCFKCSKLGHYSNECPDREKANIVYKKLRGYIDRREINLN